MTLPALHISQAIAATPAAVVEFAGNPRNLPQWAGGLSSGIRQEGEHWLSESPMGTVRVTFTGPIAAGVLDHDVLLPDGTVGHNPLRVLANGDGAEVVFTLYRLPGTTDEDFERDAAFVRADLKRLRAVLES